MKKRIIPFALLLAAFTSCSHEELPVQPAGSNPMPAPVLSRSINATTATIVGYSATGALVFTHDLHRTDAENNVWEWVSTGSVPTHAQLENVQDLVCLIPAQTVSGKTITISPDADEQLMWDKMSVTEQHTDNRFYFDQVQHRLSKICVEVDRYYSSDRLYAYYHPGGTFDCLTGEFTKLNSRTDTRICPEKNAEGLYTTTFSVVPQTFEPGDNLLRYCEEQSNGYRNYYHEMPDTTLTLLANRMLHIHTQWDTDWRKGSYVSYTVNVSGVALNATEAALDVGNTFQLQATITPSNADDKRVSWISGNTSVATVSSTGLVTAKAVGTTTVTVTTTDGGKSATCKVIVRAEIGGGLDTNGGDMDGGTTGSGPTINW